MTGRVAFFRIGPHCFLLVFRVLNIFFRGPLLPGGGATQPRAEGRELALLRWGLVPAWADDPSVGHRLANARSETAATKPSFRRAFRSRRCLVVADGFYEWQRATGRKVPYFVALRGDRPFGLAGLWERGKSTAGQSSPARS